MDPHRPRPSSTCRVICMRDAERMSGRRSPSGARAADGSRTTTCCGEVGRPRRNVFAAACRYRSRLGSSRRPGWLRSLGPGPGHPDDQGEEHGDEDREPRPGRVHRGVGFDRPMDGGVGFDRRTRGSLRRGRRWVRSSRTAARHPRRRPSLRPRRAGRPPGSSPSPRGPPPSRRAPGRSASTGPSGPSPPASTASRPLMRRPGAIGLAMTLPQRLQHPQQPPVARRLVPSQPLPRLAGVEADVDGRLRSLEVLGQQGLQPLLLLSDQLQQRRLAALRVRRPHPLQPAGR